MNLEQQVVSLELAKKLKELGVKQESLFYHVAGYIVTTKSEYYYNDGLCEYGCGCCETTAHYDKDDVYSAFTVAELGQLLPENYLICIRDNEGWYGVPISPNDKWKKMFPSKTETDARAKMLIYLIKNGLMEVPK